jgi:nucleoside transporter
MKPKSALNFLQLSLMLFLQFMLFAVWWVPLAAYLTNMGVEGTQKAMILSSMAIGCLASPLVGTIADKYLSGERVLLIMNVLTSVLLFFAARQTEPGMLFFFLLIAMIIYMPSWGLTSAIAMAHAPAEQFPRIRVFGSIGWVVSGAFSLVAMEIFDIRFDGTNIPLYCGSAVALVAALVNLTLPRTPPSKVDQKISLIDVLGLRSLSLMKDKNFAVFIVISFLAMIPFALYWSYLSQFLQDIGFKYITVTMNWGQFAEMFFLVMVSFMLKKVGVRNTMILGLLALVVRFLAFYIGGVSGMLAFYFVAILIHGIIYGFFFVGGQVYIHKKVPEELNAQTQGFIFLVTFGLGLLAGNFINGKIIEIFTETVQGASVVHWDKVWGVTTVSTIIILILFILFFRNDIGVKKEAK